MEKGETSNQGKEAGEAKKEKKEKGLIATMSSIIINFDFLVIVI